MLIFISVDNFTFTSVKILFDLIKQLEINIIFFITS